MTRHPEKVSSSRFYGEFHGHKLKDLNLLYPVLRESSDLLIWTAGDSSLDNKYWFRDQQPSVGAYADILDPPTSNADITYWLNYLCEQRRGALEPSRTAAINTAVEATTLNERTFRLRPQDRFIRDNIQENDVLIVSIGGNDIALCPLPCTLVSVLSLTSFPLSMLEKSYVTATLPCDDYCCGCGTSLLSCCGGCPPCLGYMAHLFGTRVKTYIERLVVKTKPKKILICMIYYLDENPTPSWAGQALSSLGYDRNPEKVQMAIRKFFTEGTARISIQGTEVVPVPLFHVLDGRNSRDYVARVEPSSQGGRKIAEYLLDTMNSCSQSRPDGPLQEHSQAVQTQYMAERLR